MLVVKCGKFQLPMELLLLVTFLEAENDINHEPEPIANSLMSYIHAYTRKKSLQPACWH